MSARRLVSLAVALMALLAGGAARGATAAAASGGAAATESPLLDRYASAIVRVEAVLETRVSMQGQGEAEDSRLDILGAVVDPSGLVMIWNSHISSARMTEMMASVGRGDSQMGIQVVPRSFTVTLPEGEVPAILAATDSALDLAFLQLAQPPAKPLPFVDFAQATTPGVGEQVASVTRLGRGFDYAPCLQTARIGGALRKPREAWILDGTINAFGLPVFDLAGKPVGALTTIVTRGGEGEGSAGSPTIGQMLSGAAGMTDGPLGVFVRPGARVASLVKLARDRAQELLKERAAAKP